MAYNGDMSTNTLLTGAIVREDTKNGVIMRNERGKFAPGTQSKAGIKSSADARNLAQKRWDKYRAATAKGIVAEAIAIDPSANTPEAAMALVAGKQYVALMDSDKPKVDDLYRMYQIVGGLPLAGELQAQAQSPAGTVGGIVTEILGALAAFVSDNAFDKGNYQKHEIVEGVTSEDVPDADNSDREGRGDTGG